MRHGRSALDGIYPIGVRVGVGGGGRSKHKFACDMAERLALLGESTGMHRADLG